MNQIFVDFVLNWVAPFSIIFASYFGILSAIRVVYKRTDLDAIYRTGIQIGIMLAVVVFIYAFLKNMGLFDVLHNGWVNITSRTNLDETIKAMFNNKFGE